MSINVYRSEQRIHFSNQPSVYFGWHITTSGSSESAENFATEAMRSQLVDTVRERFPYRSPYSCQVIAALLLSRHVNSDESLAAELLANEDEFKLIDHVFDDWTEVIDSIADPQESEYTVTEQP